jgi:hypothetical protein
LRAVKDINERARIISGEAQKPKETGEVIYNPVFDAFGAKALEALEAVIFSGEGPAPDVTEANRSIEVAGELLALEPKLFPSLERQASIGVVKRGEISVVAANNQRVYEALLQHTESGTLALRPGEYLASPPIASGLIPHPDWSSPFVHAEIQADYELTEIFSATEPGVAWSSRPGCGFCVPVAKWARRYP